MAGSVISSELLGLFRRREEAIELDSAALEIAQAATPGLDPAPYLQLLDTWAAALDSRLSRGAGGAEFLTKMNQFFFGELGFQGDSEDYHHPRNSCLDQVIRRRRGMPITLTVVYMELARRLLRPVYGIALPGHYVARYYDGLLSLYIDVFRGGQLMTSDQCLEMTAELLERNPYHQKDQVVLGHATKRDMIVRITTNLHIGYLKRNNRKMADKVGKILTRAYWPDTDWEQIDQVRQGSRDHLPAR